MKRHLLVLSALVALCTTISVSSAWAQANVAGNWLGLLRTPKGDIKVMMDLRKNDVGYQAILYSPDESPKAFLADTTNIQSGKAHFVWPTLGLTYNADLTDTIIHGTWSNKAGDTTLNMYRSADWMGVLNIPDREVKLSFDMGTMKDGAFEGKLFQVGEEKSATPITGVQSKDGQIYATVPAWGATLEGTMSKDGSEIAGFWKQSGVAKPIVLKGKKNSFAGGFSIKGSDLHLLFRMANVENKALAAVFQSPDQGWDAFPVNAMNLNKDSVGIRVDRVSGEFKGTFAEDKKSIKGNWSQAGVIYPLTISRQ